MSANQGIADRLTVDANLVAERDRKIGEHLSREPPWWRIWALRRWKRELQALQSLDVSFMAAMLRQLYTPETVEHLAKRHGYSVESLRMLRRHRRPEDVVLNGYPVTDLPLERDEPRELIRSVAQAVALQPPPPTRGVERLSARGLMNSAPASAVRASSDDVDYIPALNPERGDGE